MNFNQIAGYGIIILGVTGIIAGAIISGTASSSNASTALIIIGSNALSALAGAIVAHNTNKPTEAYDPNEPEKGATE
jgi:hypothetical protein